MENLAEIGCRPARMATTDGSSLPQVHALNCLRGVLRNSVFNRQAEVHISMCLQLAANSMKSEMYVLPKKRIVLSRILTTRSWAIRNCGLLLLRAIMDSLLGTGDSKDGIEKGWDGKTVRIPYIKYDTLPAILADLLRPRPDTGTGGMDSWTAESVFPGLDIVRRAGPPQKFREELFKYTSFYLGSHIWRVRDIAARTLCSFLLSEERNNALGAFLSERNVPANRIHGTLILVAAMIERLADLQDTPSGKWLVSLSRRYGTF